MCIKLLCVHVCLCMSNAFITHQTVHRSPHTFFRSKHKIHHLYINKHTLIYRIYIILLSIYYCLSPLDLIYLVMLNNGTLILLLQISCVLEKSHKTMKPHEYLYQWLHSIIVIISGTGSHRFRINYQVQF